MDCDSEPSMTGEGSAAQASQTNAPAVMEIEPTTDSVAALVVEAVARRSGEDPLSLPPLQTAVDCDSLDGLFGLQSGTSRALPEHVSVEFDYAGYTVTVADRRVVVGDPA